jgi:hypothetical protein
MCSAVDVDVAPPSTSVHPDGVVGPVALSEAKKRRRRSPAATDEGMLTATDVPLVPLPTVPQVIEGAVIELLPSSA